MRTHLTLLALSSLALVIAPAACGSSSSNTGGTGDDGGSGGSSGAGSSSGTSSGSSGAGSSSGTTGSSSGTSSSSGAGSSSGSGGSSGSSSGGTGGNHIKHIFLILMENNNWSSIKGSSSAPYINGLLTNAQASWCTNYYDNPDANHPSEPNYIWLEAATDTFPDDNDTWACDCDPSKSNSTASTSHLATLLSTHGHTWHDYAEGISGTDCPVSGSGTYAPKHVPFLFFQDISGNPPSSSTQGSCTANIVPYTQLATDLQNGTVADYNFITPNLCDDMHGSLPTCGASISNGDTWLSQQIPMIMNSNAYKDGGAIFITWDESEGGENPIGMIVLSPLAKGNGYQSTIKYYHSSMVRTVQEVFLPGVALLNDAANQPPLSDLFQAGMYP